MPSIDAAADTAGPPDKLEKALKNKISRLESELEFLEKMEKTLFSQQSSMKKIMEDLIPFISKDNTVSYDFEDVKKRYTMEVERGIHNKTLKKESSPSKTGKYNSSKKINVPDKIEEDYLGDNVDLF